MKNKNLEIERKFLVDEEKFLQIKDKYKSVEVRQGFMFEDNEKLVRIRTFGKKGFMTVKGSGLISRKEYEYEIPFGDAVDLIVDYCEKNFIVKSRYIIPYKGHTWEVDVFFGHNGGLIVAEIELDSENESFEKPDWIKEEVTGDSKYYNCNLAKIPFKNWKS
jgi:CYTH domain-containing protein